MLHQVLGERIHHQRLVVVLLLLALQRLPLGNSFNLFDAEGRYRRGRKLASAKDAAEPRFRGDRYAIQNSTIPTTSRAAALVGVEPPDKAPSKSWKRAWVAHRRALPILHLFDRTKPPDSSKALMCLWWKAISGNDVNSPVFDHGLAYDLLPRGTRLVVSKKLVRFFPRFHHANVEIRTAYLDQAIERIYEQQRSSADKPERIRLVSFGAGYDTRSVRLRESGYIDEAWELDLPNVVAAKRAIFESKRFIRWRRRHNVTLPTFLSVDLNQLQDVEQILEDIVVSPTHDDSGLATHTIFLFEGVMIYLNEGVPRGLLEMCRRILRSGSVSGSLVFADRLENIPGGDIEIGKTELASTGWKLLEWQPKPGLARHMGHAEPL